LSISSIRESAPQIWEATLGHLLLRVTRQNYDTWLRSTAGIRFEETTLVVVAPNELACDWLSTRMRSVIAQALTAVGGPGLKVRFEPPNEAMPGCLMPAELQPSLLPRLSTPLNPRFTFSSFLPGEFNQMAYLAAVDVANGTASPYSPLYITGPSGSGKTHLLHAMAHEAYAARIQVMMATAEQFVGEFTSAIRNHTGPAFRARYRDTAMFLLDDAHQLIGKKATLNEFYQTVAALRDQGSMVAIAGEATGFNASETERFQTQLQWGLVATIGSPTMEDRIRFIEAKTQTQGINLPDEVQHYLALRVRSSIRDLEGAINRVTALARISSEPMTIDFAARALQPINAVPGEEPRQIGPSALLQAVCDHLNIGIAEITGARRNRELTHARHVAMYLMRQEAGMTFAAIARHLGKKDHSTVVHACGSIEREISQSPTLRADLDAIRAIIHTDTTAA
jgi:chromosomal replication initiator protein